MGGFYRTRGSNRFGVLITFHVLTHVIDLKNPRPPRWGGSLEPVFHQNPPPSRWGGSLEPMFPQNPVLATGMISGIFPRWFRRNPDTYAQTIYIKSGRGVRVPPEPARLFFVRKVRVFHAGSDGTQTPMHKTLYIKSGRVSGFPQNQLVL